MSALTTTFRELHDRALCLRSYRKLAKDLGGIRAYGRDTPIALTYVLDVCGFAESLEALQDLETSCDFIRELSLLACDYAERVKTAKPSRDDSLPQRMIEAARRTAKNVATEEDARFISSCYPGPDWAVGKHATYFGASAWAAARLDLRGVSRIAANAFFGASGIPAWDKERAAQTRMLRDVLVKLEAGVLA